MKKIKPVVLKDAKRLSSGEMKGIRGGYDPGMDFPSSCIVSCPDGFGGGSADLTCPAQTYCDVYSGVSSDGTPFYGAGCYTQYGVHYRDLGEKLFELAELFK